MQGSRGDGGVDLGIPGYVDATFVGGGGFGAVYRALRPELNQMVAIKVMSRPATDPDTWRLFERERRSMGTLSAHPGIVTVFDSGLTAHDRRPYLIMEYLDEGSLADREPMTWQDATQVGVTVAAALQTAHDHGVLHRDIKPDNLLASSFGEVKITDFGIALLAEATGSVTTRVVGTVQYMAPELLVPQPDRPSARTDVYSLAATIMALILGKPPYGRPDDTLLTIVDEVLRAPVPDLRVRGVPAAIATVIEQAMAKDPAARYASAADFGADLGRAREEVGIAGPGGPVRIPAATRVVTPLLAEASTDVPATRAPDRRPRKLPIAWLAAGIAGVIAVVATVIAMSRPGGETAAATTPQTPAPGAVVATTTGTVGEPIPTSTLPPTTSSSTTTSPSETTVIAAQAAPPPTRSLTTQTPPCPFDPSLEGRYRGTSANLTHDLQGQVEIDVWAVEADRCEAFADMEWSEGLEGTARVRSVTGPADEIVLEGDFELRGVPYEIEVTISSFGFGELRGGYEIFQLAGGPIDAVGGGIFVASRG